MEKTIEFINFLNQDLTNKIVIPKFYIMSAFCNQNFEGHVRRAGAEQLYEKPIDFAVVQKLFCLWSILNLLI